METEDSESHVVRGLMDDQVERIVRCAVGLISLPVEPDSLHAVMRITLRITREHKHALLFAKLGGSQLLLQLTQASGFQGFTSLATLLFRHILEEPNTLKHTMEKVRISLFIHVYILMRYWIIRSRKVESHHFLLTCRYCAQLLLVLVPVLVVWYKTAWEAKNCTMYCGFWDQQHVEPQKSSLTL